MKRKGFTLIELLAVIVVLAIIALIATPMVLNTIEEARQGAAKASASSYVSEVEKYIVASQLDSSKVKLEAGETYPVSNTGEGTIVLNDIIDIKGEKPTSGTITIGADNTVASANLTINSYELECANQTCEVIGVSEEEPEEEIVYIQEPILEKAKALVYAEDGETCKIDADATDTTTYKYMDGCYIKGASTNNYVWYNGFMWRIMGINSDDTVRLITDENVTALAYGAENTGLTYEDNEGYIHDWLNEYFYSHLNSTKETVIQEGGYFCSESTNEQILTEGRTTCTEGNIVTTKIGLMAIDEYLLANQDTSYLNIGQYFWAMTPYSTSNAWYVGNSGNADYSLVTNAFGVRPVINVSSTSIITAGDGTAQNFYVLVEDKSSGITGTLSEKATSGEYVCLSENKDRVYRVVSKNDNGVKLILDNFYKETEDEIYTMAYGTDNTFNLESGIGAKLNGIEGDNGANVITWLGLSDSEKVVETTYYQGDGFDSGTTYKNTLKESNPVENVKVGLIQVGDILASQISTMLTNNYTLTSSYNNTKTYWTMNKHTSASSAWHVSNNGLAVENGVRWAAGVRPVITVDSDLTISGGNGTWKNPYEI